ncbi:MAG: hypothetical protein A3E01_07825 [Gammaproteobacteria bacterium RIFCSPHIGHO2_12_FULL_63_22]|nr:MAG: hypothetical protein A3E01_07825 [Gammaproteobacteria bacterium RIFCSPHIGHO2_12_FULL_63_22]
MLLAATVPSACAVLAAGIFLDDFPDLSGTLVNVSLFLLLLAAFKPAVRRSTSLWLLGTVFAAVFIYANQLKIGVLGAPILASDGPAGLALLKVLSGWRMAVTCLCLLGIAIALVIAVRPRAGRFYLLTLPVLVAFGLVAGAQKLHAGLIWLIPSGADEGNLSLSQRHGELAFLLYDFAVFRGESSDIPTAAQVSELLAGVKLPDRSSPTFVKRNVYLVLLESVWDPRALGYYQFSRDPFDPRFRDALVRSGDSGVLVPGFGGGTANAEFEVLCGLSAPQVTIMFERMRKNMPCLPRVLRESGYLTTASHPYDAGFWNRDHAYPLLGFKRYFPINSFELDDMDGAFLADESAFRQVLQRLSSEVASDSPPTFNYIVSLSSHYPYDRNADRRPDRVHVLPESKELSQFANAVSYTTEAFMDFVESVHARDPDAIVAGFGDHAPALGAQPDPYKLSGLSFNRKSDRERSAIALSLTPALIIDGRRGPLSFGTVPLRALPELVLSALGPGSPTLPTSAVDSLLSHRWDVRMFNGQMLARSEDGWRVCANEQSNRAACNEARRTRVALDILRRDLGRGHQYSLRMLNAANYERAVSMSQDRRFGDCELRVDDWGPKSTTQNTQFNASSDGTNSLWFRVEARRGKPTIEIGNEQADLTIGSTIASSGFNDPEFVKRPGKHEVRWTCQDGSSGLIGTFTVLPAADSQAMLALGPTPPKDRCNATVIDYGPKRVSAGKPFNVQPDGRSAIWIKVAPKSGNFRLVVAGEPLQFTHAGQIVSLLSQGALEKALSRPGQVDLEFRCDGVLAASASIEVSTALIGER